MTETSDTSPAFKALLARISGDLQPVRPFAMTRWMALFVLVFAALCTAMLWRNVDWRTDHEALGSPWLWGLSAVELVIALVLLAWVLREALPGRNPSLALLVGVAVAACLLHFAVWLATLARSPVQVPEGMGWVYGIYCFRYEVALGVPCLLFALWLSSRGLTSRPRRVGALGGIGAGLAADAIWRLFCPYSDPAHALGSHSLGILAVLLGGLMCTACWDAVRLRTFRNRMLSRTG